MVSPNYLYYGAILFSSQFCRLASAQDLQAVVDSIREDVAAVIQQDRPLAAKFLRLAFHDAVGGGNDGCVDLQDPENFGLDVPIEALEPIVKLYTEDSPSNLSRADIWVLAALVGCEESQNNLRFPMNYFGRKDCDSPGSTVDCSGLDGTPRACSATTGPRGEFPHPDLTTSELLHYFSQEFNFTPRQTVAIMGAHTIGVAARENSGFQGSNGWVDDKEELDNEYYELLVGGNSPDDSLDNLVNRAPNWGRETVDNDDNQFPDRFVWRRRPRNGGNPLIMMNSDVAIVRDLEGRLVGEANEATCSFNGNGDGNICPHAAATLEFAAEYRFDNEVWLTDFREAMNAMTTFGYDIAPDCGDNVCLRLVADGVPETSTMAPSTGKPTTSPTAAPTATATTATPIAPPTLAPVVSNAADQTLSPTTVVPTLAPVGSNTANPTLSPIPMPTGMPTTADEPTLQPVESSTGDSDPDTPTETDAASEDGLGDSDESGSNLEGAALSSPATMMLTKNIVWCLLPASLLWIL